MKHLTAPLFLLFLSLTCLAATVDTILVHSPSMKKDIRCVIVRPTANHSQQTPQTSLPVIYLLHGWAGDYAQWIGTAPQLPQKADELGVLFVCPDAGFDS